MTDDLNGVSTQAQENTAVDAEYAGWDETVPDARVSGQTIPAFGFYIVQPFTGKLRDAKPGVTPSGRVGVKVLEGPNGTIGERVFDDIYLGVSQEKQGDEIGPNGRPIKVPKTAAEIAKSTTFFQHSLNRLAQALGLALKRPVSKQEGALEAYLSQFEGDDRPAMVVEINIDAKGGTPRNRIQWSGARNPQEPAVDKKLAAAGKTALDEARQRIAERNKVKGNVTAQSAVAQPGGNGASPSLD